MSYIEILLENLIQSEQYRAIDDILYYFPYEQVHNRIHDLENIKKILDSINRHLYYWNGFIAKIEKLKQENGHYECVNNLR